MRLVLLFNEVTFSHENITYMYCIEKDNEKVDETKLCDFLNLLYIKDEKYVIKDSCAVLAKFNVSVNRTKYLYRIIDINEGTKLYKEIKGNNYNDISLWVSENTHKYWGTTDFTLFDSLTSFKRFCKGHGLNVSCKKFRSMAESSEDMMGCKYIAKKIKLSGCDAITAEDINKVDVIYVLWSTETNSSIGYTYDCNIAMQLSELILYNNRYRLYKVIRNKKVITPYLSLVTKAGYYSIAMLNHEITKKSIAKWRILG